MKLSSLCRLVFLITTATSSAIHSASSQPYTDDYKIVLEPMWIDLDHGHHDPAKVAAFGGIWILAGSITFEKKAKESVSLHRLHLQWLGTDLDNLTASLYRKTPDKQFYPIEANLVCDGVWCKKKQTLLFTFNQQQTLGVRNIFYLVLTVPPELEYTMKQGRFSLLSYTLPEPFRPAAKDDQLCLNLDALGSVTSYVPLQ